MHFVLQPWQLFRALLAGWSNRQQQEVIDYLRAENQILREKRGKRRIVHTVDQRRRLAVQGKVLGRKVLESLDDRLPWQNRFIRQLPGIAASDQSMSRRRTRGQVFNAGSSCSSFLTKTSQALFL